MSIEHTLNVRMRNHCLSARCCPESGVHAMAGGPDCQSAAVTRYTTMLEGLLTGAASDDDGHEAASNPTAPQIATHRDLEQEIQAGKGPEPHRAVHAGSFKMSTCGRASHGMGTSSSAALAG